MNEAGRYDVLIIGGGPAGATAAIQLARSGLHAAIFEKASFPRFQIGESFLPANYQLMERMGLGEKLRAIPHMWKYGARFGMGSGNDWVAFRFNGTMVDDGTPTKKIQVRIGGDNRTINVLRSDFDKMMLDEARAAGAEVHEQTAVQSIDHLADDDVRITAGGKSYTGRYLFDASGDATVLGRHLGTRRLRTESYLQNIAYFQHFKNVDLLKGTMSGSPSVVMCDEGWFWIIPVDPTTASVGMVMDRNVIKRVGVKANKMLRWGIERCPAMQSVMMKASGPETNMVRSDFSFTCEPFAGPGFFMLGDAAMFLDPIFSAGVCIGMLGGDYAADQVKEVVAGRLSPAAAQKRYRKYMIGGTRYFKLTIRHFYRHPFRELFLNGAGPLQVHEALLAVLAGHVFPKPAFWIRWRCHLLNGFVKAQRFLPLVPSRPHHSLLATEPGGPMPAIDENGSTLDT
jgi:flavin-dependent dehydrogenase